MRCDDWRREEVGANVDERREGRAITGEMRIEHQEFEQNEERKMQTFCCCCCCSFALFHSLLLVFYERSESRMTKGSNEKRAEIRKRSLLCFCSRKTLARLVLPP